MLYFRGENYEYYKKADQAMVLSSGDYQFTAYRLLYPDRRVTLLGYNGIIKVSEPCGPAWLAGEELEPSISDYPFLDNQRIAVYATRRI